jgi:hypothetical protein
MKRLLLKSLIAETIQNKTLKESSMPPGFGSTDVQSIDKFIKSSGVSSEENPDELNETGAGHDVAGDNVSDIDIDAAIDKKIAGEKDKETPYIHASNIRDEHGNAVDPEELKKKISVKPEHILSQNAKIKKSGKGKTYVFYNITLPAYKGLFFDEKDNKFKIVTTCPSAGACKVFCYARKGGYVMFPEASIKSTKIVNYLMNNWQGFKSQLIGEIKAAHEKNKKKDTKVVIRWHDSGDFMSEKYLQIAYDIAKETPEVTHYAYTKRVKMVSGSDIPKNFVFNFSMGGTEDASIDKKTQKHSEVVPKKLFHDLVEKDKATGTNKFISAEAEKEVKKRIADHYGIPFSSIVTYNELMDIDYDENDESVKQKYNVLVKSGDGDDSAMRKDVLGTYLFIH